MNNNKLKGWLYYSDLIYKIKSLAGLIQIEDEEIENRIQMREQMIENIEENGLVTYGFSEFQYDVFKIVRKISKRANVPFRSLYEISKYPELVNETLIELEKKNDLHLNYLMSKQHFSPLAVPNRRTKAFMITPEMALKLLEKKAALESIQRVHERAREFEINNLQKNTPKLIKKQNFNK